MVGVTVRLADMLSPELLAAHQEHIESFLLQEGIVVDRVHLGETLLSERQVKELLAELAEGLT